MASGIQDLAVQLGVAFIVILVGYALRALNIFTSHHASGISKFCTFIALPSYLFLAMLTLDFTDVKWGFFAAVLLGKGIIGGATAIASFTFDTGSPAPMASACMRVIMTTFSNDYALGAPVLLALYPPEVSKYLFIVAPVSLLIINPLCLVLTEISATRNGLRSNTSAQRSLLRIVVQVLRKPVVSMVILGLVLNPAFGGNPPTFLRSLFDVLGRSFAGPALFNIGGNMHGKFKSMKGRSLFAPAMLICSKIILLPIIIAMLIPMFGASEVSVPNEDQPEDVTSYSLTLFGFIVGSLPSATAVFFLSWEFGILLTESTAVIVIGTLSAAPLMLIAAQVAQLSIEGVQDYEGLLQSTSEYISVASLVGGMWLLIATAFARPAPSGQRLNLPAMCVAIIAHGVAVQTCASDSAHGLARYMAVWVALSCLKATVALNVVSLAVKHRYGCEAAAKMQRFGHISAAILALLLSGLAYARFEASVLDNYHLDHSHCWIVLDYRRNEALITDVLVNVVLLIIMMISVVVLCYPTHYALEAASPFPQPSKRIWDQGQTGGDESDDNKDHGHGKHADKSLDANVLDQGNSTSIEDTTGSASAQHQHFADTPDINPLELSSVSDNGSKASTSFDDNPSVHDIGPSPAQSDRPRMSASIGQSWASRESLRTTDVSFRDVVFVALELTCWVISVFAQTWLLAGGGTTKIFAMVAFLEVFLVSSQGILVLLVFGTKRRYKEPYIYLVSCLTMRQTIDANVTQLTRAERLQRLDKEVRRLVEVFLDLLPQLRELHDNVEPLVVRTTTLILFLLEHELLQSREEAILFCQQLQRLGYLRMRNQQTFEDDATLCCELHSEFPDEA
eukprot:TRINITY_DN10854_c0_g1_i6.p1 TRINITY_DN10854_c0_g1~~TRINITY_DN10854_c0_g1_i6.p1  ORF type:complete len:849 (+),score=177.43 TRINITY_DN10854_c0_g1_i6:1420-3966(+)